jgi:hypothetical protein
MARNKRRKPKSQQPKRQQRSKGYYDPGRSPRPAAVRTLLKNGGIFAPNPGKSAE